jgi:transposase-like protein
VRRHPGTPAERVPLVATLLAHAGEYGVVTAVSRASGVCRQTLYRWRDRAHAALVAAFAPPAPAAAPAAPPLARAILTLLVEAHASSRGIQACLAELLGRRVRLATVVAVVRAAGARAQALLAAAVPPVPVPLALDEAFGARPRDGYLSAVDARTGAVWAAAGPTTPEAATWTAVLEGLAGRGLRWPVTVHDGGKAAAGGAAAAAAAPRQRDLWHVLHRCAQAQARLERLVVAAEAGWERAERYEAAVAAGGRPRHRPPAVPAGAQAARVDALAAAAAGTAYLTGEVRRLLGVVVVEGGRLLDAAARRAELAAALALLAELAAPAPPAAQAELTKLHAHLADALDGLLVFAAALDPVQRDMAAAVLGAAGVALAAWAWERRAVLGDGDALLAQLPAAWRPAARVLLAAWAGAVRASSAVEGWHAVLRPHLAVHRTLSPGLLAVLAVRHNHRVAPRGAHAGQSPLQRSGLAEADPDWLGLLTAPPAAAEPPDDAEEGLAA